MMNKNPLEMSDAEIVNAHKLALKESRLLTDAISALEWHILVRDHIKKQARQNRINELREAADALENELEAG